MGHRIGPGGRQGLAALWGNVIKFCNEAIAAGRSPLRPWYLHFHASHLPSVSHAENVVMTKMGPEIERDFVHTWKIRCSVDAP